MADRPLVLVHGYSDSARGFEAWRRIITREWRRPVTSLHVGQYVSLSNEVTLKDVAEGFDRALRHQQGLKEDEPFDAIVHSTGMLVVRAWLGSAAEGERRRRRLRHLVALAPATNGSPLAHKGRSWLGSVFKGNRERGPDFMEAGDEILHALELASRFTWDLAHEDQLGDEPRFPPGGDAPWVFTLCGTRNYGFLKSLFTDEAGSDGTVRWAGCALDSRKVTIDMMVPAGSDRTPEVTISGWENRDHPLVLVGGLNHGTIMSRPSRLLKELVRSALEVDSDDAFRTWNRDALRRTRAARERVERWQQFVIRVVDERGDAVTDWNAQLTGRRNARDPLRPFAMDVHVFKRDPSLRCFHVNLDDLDPDRLDQLHLRLIASSGTRLVAYHGAGSERIRKDGTAMDPEGKWDARINLTETLGRDGGFHLFRPFTTTFIEVRLNREPMPMVGRNDVFWFPGAG